MKKLPFIALLLVFMVACKPNNGIVWTKDYEQKTYDEIYKGLGGTLKDEAQRKQFASYLIRRLKKELPGGLESISADSLHNLGFKIGQEYAHNDSLKAAVAWSPTVEDAIRASIMKAIAKKIPDENRQNKFCDCAIAELKHRDPDSLMVPLPDKVYKEIAGDCMAKK